MALFIFGRLPFYTDSTLKSMVGMTVLLCRRVTSLFLFVAKLDMILNTLWGRSVDQLSSQKVRRGKAIGHSE